MLCATDANRKHDNRHNLMRLSKFRQFSINKRITIIVFLCLLTLSLFFTAFTIEESNNSGLREITSIEALLSGWLGALTLDFASFSWFANPLIVLAIIFFDEQPRMALLLSIIAVFTALSFLLANEIVANEGGGTRTILTVDTGYYLWLSSLITTSAISLYTTFTRQKR